MWSIQVWHQDHWETETIGLGGLKATFDTEAEAEAAITQLTALYDDGTLFRLVQHPAEGIIVVFFGADGRKAGEATYPTRQEALIAARAYVSRNGMHSYKTRRNGMHTRYFHSYGEREALVKD
jgi:hypothetical protein